MAKSAASAFDKQLKQALKYLNDPDRLAAESVLATAYFLGNSAISAEVGSGLGAELSSVGAEPHWGRLLRHALQRAAHALWGATPPRHREEIEAAWSDVLAAPGTPRYSYLILELRYFQQFFRPRSLQQIWQEFLQQSRAEFYRDVDQAIGDLGEALLQTLRPGMRLESPPVAGSIVGRAAMQQRIQAALHSGQSVGLTGASGAGKTSLAAGVAQSWPTPTLFWFTVRPELNDRYYQLLYALGAFLHRYGATDLWRALAANQGRIEEPALLLTLARRDLQSLATQQPLLILDEVDLWRPDEANTAQINQFLVGLQEVAPLLAVGQQAALTTAQQVTLAALSVSDTAALLEQNDLTVSPTAVQRLHEATHGNPRLLWLCLDLLRQGEALETILSDRPGHAQPFDSYLNLLWQRLDGSERGLAQALAVYPVHAPRDPWPEGAVEQLRARHLLTDDGAGGLALLPGVRAAVLRTLSAEQQEARHQQAGVLYAERAEYTLAAYHFHHGAQPATAVRIWYPRREAEIARGQAAGAAAIFDAISGTSLTKRDRAALTVIRAELHQLTGNLQAGLAAVDAELAHGETDSPHESMNEASRDAEALTLEIQRLQGDFLDALGRPDAALSAYARGLKTVTRLQQRTVDLHVRRGMVNVRQRRLAAAWQAAQQARYQAEQLQGLVQEEQGDLGAAEAHYQAALEIARQIDDARGQAESNRCLCNIYGRRGAVAQAEGYAQAAIAHYAEIGDLVNAALVQSNLAAAYLDAGDHARVLEIGLPAFEFFQQQGYSHRLAATACNLAEAYLELGDYPAAEHYADLAIRQEEPLAMPYALYTLALVRHAHRNVDACLQLLSQCRQIAQENEDIFIEAYAWLKTAELLSVGNAAEAEPARDEAARLFTRLGMPELAAQAQVN